MRVQALALLATKIAQDSPRWRYRAYSAQSPAVVDVGKSLVLSCFGQDSTLTSTDPAKFRPLLVNTARLVFLSPHLCRVRYSPPFTRICILQSMSSKYPLPILPLADFPRPPSSFETVESPWSWEPHQTGTHSSQLQCSAAQHPAAIGV